MWQALQQGVRGSGSLSCSAGQLLPLFPQRSGMSGVQDPHRVWAGGRGPGLGCTICKLTEGEAPVTGVNPGWKHSAVTELPVLKAANGLCSVSLGLHPSIGSKCRMEMWISEMVLAILPKTFSYVILLHIMPSVGNCTWTCRKVVLAKWLCCW